MNREEALEEIFCNKAYVFVTNEGYLELKREDNSTITPHIVRDIPFASLFDNPKKAYKKFNRMTKKNQSLYNGAVLKKVKYMNIASTSAIFEYEKVKKRVFEIEGKIKVKQDKPHERIRRI